jgi:hypothetical protein
MTVLLDSNILARLAQPTHPKHAATRDAVAALQARGETLVIVPQNVFGLWQPAGWP